MSNLPGSIAVLGATSHLAKDFIRTACSAGGQGYRLYARNPDAVDAFLAANGLGAVGKAEALAAFGREDYSAILNFVGAGDPARIKTLGSEILSVTRAADEMVLEYLLRKPKTVYVFMSSGAVYGNAFAAPVTETSEAVIPINAFGPQDYYAAAKLYAEARHRSLAEQTIVDLRIFNYISRTLDVNARFLISELIQACRTGTVFRTNSSTVIRDFLHPEDFFALIKSCVYSAAGTNRPVDAYSCAPISKSELLQLMSEEFGLRYEITDDANVVNATGLKPHYYSTNRRAAELGYAPKYSSRSGIVEELRFILGP